MQLVIGNSNFNPKDFYGAELTVTRCESLISLIKQSKYKGWKDDAREVEFMLGMAKRGMPGSVKPMSSVFVAINRLIQSQVNVDFLMDESDSKNSEDQ